MKKLFRIIYTFILCLCFAGVLSKPAEAARKNPDDVTKLQKFVNEQIKKGAMLSGNVKQNTGNVQYKWDKNENLKEIVWWECNLTGSIKLPSFKKLKSVSVKVNPGLKAFDAGRNPSLTTLAITGCTKSTFEIYNKRFAINKLSVKGCKNLETLYAGWNNIKYIDLSNNKKLELLDLSGCKLKELDISSNKKLDCLIISYNKKLSGINLKNCPFIRFLDISGNKFLKLNLSHNTRLETFYCDMTRFTKIDLRKNNKIKNLSCCNGNLKEDGLVIGKNPNMSIIRCRGNKLSEIDISRCANLKYLECGKNKLNKLNVEKCVNLELLYCNNNVITKLNLSKNNKLKDLNCSKNSLKKLKLDNLEDLQLLNCNNCKLADIDLGKIKKLNVLCCDNNKIKKLNISKLKDLYYLACRNNLLIVLDVTNNSMLQDIHCENNKIKELDISNCIVKDYLNFGDEFFTYDDGVVLVKKCKNKSGFIYKITG